MKARKKLLLFILCELILIAFNFYFSQGIYQVLLTGRIELVQLKYTIIINSMFVSETHRLLFLCMNVVGMMILLAVMFLDRKSYESELTKITPQISTPISVGQKQFGSARWMRDKEKDRYFLNGCGVVIGMKKKWGKEKIYTIHEDVHTLCIGATRSGKSRSVVLQTIGVLAGGKESMVISDPKGELHAYTKEYLKEKEYKVVAIDFRNPLKSARYNYLQPIINAVNEGNIPKAIELTWDLTTVLVGESRGEKIWTHGEVSVIASAIMSVVYDNQSKADSIYQNMSNVYYFIAEMTKEISGKMPIENYIKSLDDHHPAKGLLSISEVAPNKTRGSFYTSALTTLRLFTNPLIYEMSKESDFDPVQIPREKTALFIILPDEKTTYYPLASLLISQFYAELINEADTRGGRLKVRVNFILDEFGNFTAIPDFASKLTVGGSRGIRFELFIQSLSQLDEKYGRDISRIIRGNCEVWIYLKANDLETLEEISKKLGKYTVSTYALNSSSREYSASSQGQNVSLTARELLTADEVRAINRPYALVLSSSPPAIMNLPDISQYHFNALFGMGDKEHNRFLRERRESERTLRSAGEIDMKLWNVWKYYSSQLKRETKVFTYNRSQQKQTKEESNEKDTKDSKQT